MLETQNVKRPASHRWAIGILGFISCGFIVILIDLLRGRSGATFAQYSSELIILSMCFLTFCSLVIGGQRIAAYYTTAVGLGALSVRAIYVLGLYARIYLKGHVTSHTYFHIAERGRPLAEQQASAAIPFGVPVMTCLFILLFCRFAFGRQSRSYFGMPPLRVKSDTAI